MVHSPSDARDVIVSECEFPAAQEEVAAALEEEAIRSPSGEPVDIPSVLAVTDEEEFATADEVHNTVLANLSEDHVGRKHYDDRSHNPAHDDHVSF
ncbi:MAG: hypothetical protein ABEJ67_00360 [Halanaeroarchaeum sp.]